MTDHDFDALFTTAEEDLREQEIPDDWGFLRVTEPGDRILARFLGRDTMAPFNDVIYRFLEYETGEPFYLKQKAQLEKVLEFANVGDLVGLVRGRDKDIGKPNPMECWAGWVRPCDDPLTAKPEPGTGKPAGTDTDIPFLCPAGDETRSAPTAAAVTR